MDTSFINEVKEKLLEQRKTILMSLENQDSDMKGLIKPVASGDEIDIASDAVDRTLLGSLGSQDLNLLKQIDNALNRIRQNRYGICVNCGKEISAARLTAIPYALTCIDCANAERKKRG